VVQQALVQKMNPIFEPLFAGCSFGYRPGRSPDMAMRKVWQEIQEGNFWILDAAPQTGHRCGGAREARGVRAAIQTAASMRVERAMRSSACNASLGRSSYASPRRSRRGSRQGAASFARRSRRPAQRSGRRPKLPPAATRGALPPARRASPRMRPNTWIS